MEKKRKEIRKREGDRKKERKGGGGSHFNILNFLSLYSFSLTLIDSLDTLAVSPTQYSSLLLHPLNF